MSALKRADRFHTSRSSKPGIFDQLKGIRY